MGAEQEDNMIYRYEFTRLLVANLGRAFGSIGSYHPYWGIHTAHFRDLDGNLIEINQPLQPTKLAGQWR